MLIGPWEVWPKERENSISVTSILLSWLLKAAGAGAEHLGMQNWESLVMGLLGLQKVVGLVSLDGLGDSSPKSSESSSIASAWDSK